MGSFTSRLFAVGISFTLLGVIILSQLIMIQNDPVAKDIRQQNEEQYSYYHDQIVPERGNIYDKNGNLLAGNKNVYEIGVTLPNVKNKTTITETLSSVLGLDYQEIASKMNPDPELGLVYVRVADFIEPDKITRLEEIYNTYENAGKNTFSSNENTPSLEGISWNSHLQRSYPEHSLAANILGFYSYLNIDGGKGYFGVEEKYDDLLSGVPVDVMVPLDPNVEFEVPKVTPGDSLILTIDREIQEMAESIVDQAVIDNGAASGTIIIMDPENGDILAMAVTPRLDINNYWEYEQMFPDSSPFNRAVGETYEPGSVFKVLTMAAALDIGMVTPETPFVDTGVVTVGGLPLYNWDRGAWGPQNMIGCMQHSLNVCLASLAVDMGPDIFYQYLKEFGVDRKTNIDLADEVSWPLSTPGDPEWYEVNLGTNSFGQGLAVTPIQMVTSISAVANDGKMMAPHVLKAVISDGKQYNNTPQVINTPISEQTAHTLTDMLAISLEEEASTALIPGYRVAGKTGTGSIADPIKGYILEETNASFVGWGPADDPKFIVYIWIEKPTSSPWGSEVAAPIFSEIVKRLVVLIDLPPDSIRQQQAQTIAQ